MKNEIHCSACGVIQKPDIVKYIERGEVVGDATVVRNPCHECGCATLHVGMATRFLSEDAA